MKSQRGDRTHELSKGVRWGEGGGDQKRFQIKLKLHLGGKILMATSWKTLLYLVTTNQMYF